MSAWSVAKYRWTNGLPLQDRARMTMSHKFPRNHVVRHVWPNVLGSTCTQPRHVATSIRPNEQGGLDCSRCVCSRGQSVNANMLRPCPTLAMAKSKALNMLTNSCMATQDATRAHITIRQSTEKLVEIAYAQIAPKQAKSHTMPT